MSLSNNLSLFLMINSKVSFADHVPDASRAEDAFVLSFGSELIGMQRDWNEELQSCREFPYKTPQERCILLFSVFLGQC